MSDYFERVEHQLVRGVEAHGGRRLGPRLRLDYLATAAAVLVVLVIGAAFLSLRGHGASGSSAAAGNGLVFTASGLGGRAATPAAIDRSVTIMRRRLTALVPGAQVSGAGGQVIVSLKHPSSAVRARVLALSVPGRLAMYDWEANVLTPNGRTVASQLSRQDPSALTLSQGNGGTATGGLGAGSLTLRQARSLAARARSRYRVGTVVLRAASQPSAPVPAQFYVLVDRVALSGRDVVKPQQSINAAGSPDVMFRFTSRGKSAFATVTSAVAHRGATVSGLGQLLNQHFAIALDGQLISVPSIDFKAYPDGIIGGGGADIAGPFTVGSARDLATLLRFGSLGVRLDLR